MFNINTCGSKALYIKIKSSLAYKEKKKKKNTLAVSNTFSPYSVSLLHGKRTGWAALDGVTSWQLALGSSVLRSHLISLMFSSGNWFSSNLLSLRALQRLSLEMLGFAASGGLTTQVKSKLEYLNLRTKKERVVLQPLLHWVYWI